MSTKILYIICSMIIFIALIIDDIILMLLALSVVVTSITDAWWRQEIDRKNRISDKWSFSIQPDFKNVAKGNSQTIKCQIYNLPDDTKISNAAWFLNQPNSNQISRLSMDPKKYSSGSDENPWLTIMNFQHDDEGTYSCEIENDVGIKKGGSAYLAFTEKPVPVTSPINKECSKRSTQKVRCIVRGNKLKDLLWVKVSKGTAKQVSLCCEKYEGGTVEKPSLSIRNFTMEDEGTYVCNAANDAGIGSSNGTSLTYILDASDHQNLEDNFHRLVKFVVHIAGDVTKKYFDSCILKADSFENYLKKNVDKILHLHEPHPCCRCSFKCCKCAKACSCKCECKFMLTKDQISILFEHDKNMFNRKHTRGKDGSRQRCTCSYKVKSSVSLSDVDISLLSILITNVHGVNITLGVDKKCEDIRKVRNYVFHQSDSQSIVNQEFENKWKILKESSEFFLYYINDEQYNENFYKNINEIRGSMMIASDSFVQQQIFQEFCRDKCAELQKRHQEEFRLTFSRFEQIIMDEDTLIEKAAPEIEALQTVVNEVVIRVFGNSDLKKKIESKDEGTIDEGQGTIPVLLQMDVPDNWDENEITKALQEIHLSQMNKEAGVKIKSYSYKNLDIILDVLKHIMNDIHELHHEVIPLISGFLSYIDTKEKADVDLKMIAPEELKLEIGPAKKTVLNGDSHTIECHISGKPAPFTIQWTKKKNGEEIKIVPLQEKYSGGTVSCPSLTIKCFIIDDEGIYICKATNEAGVGISNKSQLIYIEKPMVKVSPEKQSVVRGTTKTIKCSVSGIPQPILLWIRVNDGEEAIIRLFNEKYTGGNVDCPSLTIINFNKNDEGVYFCKATNDAGEGISNQSFLTYIEKPMVKVSPEKQSVVRGTAQTIKCSISGIPQPILLWIRVNDGEEEILKLSKEKYTGGNVDCPSLTIKDFNKNDEGVYVCKATNEAGEGISNQSFLTYIEKPMVKVSPEKQSVVKGTAQTIKCSVSGIPQPILLWIRVNDGEEEILKLSKEKYTGGNVDCPSLTIIDFNKNDEGVYVCKATNEAGEGISNESFLTYIEKPMVKVSPEKQSVVRGTAQTIKCSVSGIPQPVLLWIRVNDGEEEILKLSKEKYTGGNVDCPSLTMKDFNKNDEGVYVCKATNEAGEGISNESFLTYIEKPMVKVSPEKQSVVKGTAQIIKCSVSGIPKPILLWIRVNDGEEEILKLSKEKYTGGNVDCPSLTIKDFNKNDEGVYVCKATNEAGEGISNESFLTYIENVPATEEAFALAETPVKYNFPVSVTLRQQLQVTMSGYESSINDCIKIGNKLVFADYNGSQLITCNADGTDEHNIPLDRKPWHITEIDSDTVAVSCIGRTIKLINIYTDKVIKSIKTRKHCHAISYDDNILYVVIGDGIVRVMDLKGTIIRSFIPSPSQRIVDITVKGDILVCFYETSIYRCSVDGTILWKFDNEKCQCLNSVTTDEKDNIYVTDFNSNTVFVVSGDGKHYEELFIDAVGLNRTSVIHFDRNENVLLVCKNKQYEGGKAFLFDIKKTI